MATSIYEGLGKGRQMSFWLRTYLTRLMCMKTEYPHWTCIRSYRNYFKFNLFFGKVQKIDGEGRAVSVCSFTRLHPYLSRLVDYYMMDAQHSPSGFSIFPDDMVARNITFMQDTFSRKLVGELHPHLATKHPDLYTMVARVDIPYNPRVPVCFLYVGNLFILEDHEKFSDRQDQHPCNFTHKKRRCRVVPNMAEFLDRTSMMSYPHPAEFLHHRSLDRCHFIFKGYGTLYQVLDAIAGGEIFV